MNGLIIRRRNSNSYNHNHDYCYYIIRACGTLSSDRWDFLVSLVLDFMGNRGMLYTFLVRGTTRQDVPLPMLFLCGSGIFIEEGFDIGRPADIGIRQRKGSYCFDAGKRGSTATGGAIKEIAPHPYQQSPRMVSPTQSPGIRKIAQVSS